MRTTLAEQAFQYYQKNDEPRDHGRQAVAGGSLRSILIVDDEIHITQTYRRIFSREGFQVLTALSVPEAKDILVREQVDIVVMDINMPELNGTVLFDIIRASYKNVRVFIASVYSIDEQKERIKGADGYFDKSDSNDVLVGMVGGVLKNA